MLGILDQDSLAAPEIALDHCSDQLPLSASVQQNHPPRIVLKIHYLSTQEGIILEKVAQHTIIDLAEEQLEYQTH